MNVNGVSEFMYTSIFPDKRPAPSPVFNIKLSLLFWKNHKFIEVKKKKSITVLTLGKILFGYTIT